jgi:hypothetical protein
MRALLAACLLLVAGEASAQSEFIKGPCQASELASGSCAPRLLGQQARVYTSSASATDCTVFGTTLALCAWNGSTWVGFTPGAGSGLSAASIYDVPAGTSSATLSNCYGAAITNASADRDATVTLCAAKKGMDVWVFVESLSFDLTVDVASGERIALPDTSATDHALKYECTGGVCTSGSNFHLVCISDGTWKVTSTRGMSLVDVP